ncbi:3-hydroxyacyl-ACP dehydratase FabZ family protein [Allomuricauda sp. SCSIO 65647]|uniref:3-hydroxyacyl-ACP dehydratase FabZ family protein n=1 Tax=Allomuricauda sp. SCSIO 65647 TaxID=2908843 RepID=UPI001F1885B7|nr:hydroxymyristoyl-ACP dehydratase [Muricauda sp. SCSIO 65647]UJH67396.1 hydroxymyristoyl-ACP dehydratase [Muricauda sp. SCSIO 65647]
MKPEEILQNLPYAKPFLFVDELLYVDENGAKGLFTFSQEMDCYKGHFKDHPVTPGVLLTECCAQIGLVCLGSYLLGQESSATIAERLQIALSSSEMEFLLPVFPNETVTVVSEKVYYRFQKLKCKVKMFNEKNELVCRGTLSGMLIKRMDAE